jgi:hypothetical protein
VNILVATLIIAGACALTCGLLLAVHRWGGRDALLADTTRGAGVYGVVGTSFAVLLAFVVLIAFESYNDARGGAEQEADAMVELFRTAGFFPEESKEIQDNVLCYGRAVVFHDWNAMRDQERSPVVDKWALALHDDYEQLQPTGVKQEAAFAHLLDLQDKRVDARRQRLTQATPTITTPVWFILGIGAFLNIGFVLVFLDRRGESLLVHCILMASITTVVVAGLLLVWFLDHPYQDADGSIQPIEMERTISELEQEEPGLRPPCDADGAPLAESA